MNDLLLKLLIDVDKSCFKDNTSLDEIIYASNLAYRKLTKGKSKIKKIYRIAGQSGSGKTSTLFEPLVFSFEERNINPVKLGVRFFSKFHPKFEELLRKFGKANIRELTNGFALKCLIFCLFKLFKNGYLIVLDITFLMPSFEKYLNFLINKFDFTCQYHIIALNRTISKKFIAKRQNECGDEGGRKIKKSSEKFFYKHLFSSFKLISKIDEISIVKIWTPIAFNPFCFNNLKSAKCCFKKLRKIKDKNLICKNAVVSFRKKYFKNLEC